MKHEFSANAAPSVAARNPQQLNVSPALVEKRMVNRVRRKVRNAAAELSVRFSNKPCSSFTVLAYRRRKPIAELLCIFGRHCSQYRLIGALQQRMNGKVIGRNDASNTHVKPNA